LASIITDFIRNTKQELNDEKLEDALEMLDLEWGKDKDTRTQCNRLNTDPLHRGNAFNTNGPARVKMWMQWLVGQRFSVVNLLKLFLLPQRVHTTLFINPGRCKTSSVGKMLHVRFTKIAEWQTREKQL